MTSGRGTGAPAEESRETPTELAWVVSSKVTRGRVKSTEPAEEMRDKPAEEMRDRRDEDQGDAGRSAEAVRETCPEGAPSSSDASDGSYGVTGEKAGARES